MLTKNELIDLDLIHHDYDTDTIDHDTFKN